MVWRLTEGDGARLRSRDAEVAAIRAPFAVSRVGVAVDVGVEGLLVVWLVAVFWKARDAPLKAVLYVASSCTG